MAELGNVQAKMSCVFASIVVEETSPKRPDQLYRVIAGEHVRDSAKDDDIYRATPTEKVDGTCVLIAESEGKPWLWPRLDRKAIKPVAERFRTFRTKMSKWDFDGREGPEPHFEWDAAADLKPVPEKWMPASGVPLLDGVPQRDANGHMPGWVPVDPSSQQHCWLLTAVDLDHGLGLVLQPSDDENSTHLEVKIRRLADLEGMTMELIGTTVNANPYNIGSKKVPVHLLVRHGSIPIEDPPPVDHHELKKWLSSHPNGNVEGIVWHCRNGQMYKVHRDHVELSWPTEDIRLCRIPVDIKVDLSEHAGVRQELFLLLDGFNGQTFGSVSEIAKMEPQE